MQLMLVTIRHCSEPSVPCLNRGDICLRCTKIALAHSFFAIFDFVVRRANLYSKDVEVFRIVIHWFFKVKKFLLEGVH